MTNNKTAVTIIFLSLLVLVGGMFLVNATQTPALESNQNTRLRVLGSKTHSWGDIDYDGGVVTKTFEVENIGDEPLEITGVKTSCMCTEAKVLINGDESPVFGMHTQSSWKGIVEPHDTAEVLVAFDPTYHGPQGVGPITRLVSFDTNDPQNSRIEFEVTGKVYK